MGLGPLLPEAQIYLCARSPGVHSWHCQITYTAGIYTQDPSTWVLPVYILLQVILLHNKYSPCAVQSHGLTRHALNHRDCKPSLAGFDC